MLIGPWALVVRSVIFTLVLYITLVTLLRISGKRTLSQMDPFDFVITTALGSTLAQTILSRDISLVRGTSVFATLIGLQFVASYFASHTKFVRKLIKGTPRLLFYNGEFLEDALKQEHVPHIEVLAAIREHGLADIHEVLAVVLEADSKFSVITQSESKEHSSLEDVRPAGQESPHETRHEKNPSVPER